MNAPHILVCVKFVPPETAGQPAASPGGRILNPADEAAVEAALCHRGGGRVTVLSMGPAVCQQGLRELLAVGIDRAVLLCDPVCAGADSYATALALAAGVRSLGHFDLALCGRRAVDGETGQLPPELAVQLDLPCVTNLLELAWQGESLVCRRLVENGVETLLCPSPAVLSLCEYSYRLRLPSLGSLRAARTKQVELVTAAHLGLDVAWCGQAGSPTRVARSQPNRQGLRHPVMLEPRALADTLLQLLREVSP